MNQDDATTIILDLLRRVATEVKNYGYDLYIPSVIRKHLGDENPNRPQHEFDNGVDQLSPDFYAAAWDLCRRGILRPSVRRAGAQATPDGSGGNGYSLTPLGVEYLAQAQHATPIPLGPGRFEQMIKPFSGLLGPGFTERAVEAIRCYRSAAFVACCAMAGAAAESLILATAIAKTRDEEAVLKAYSGSQGRGRIENLLVGKAPEHLRREFVGFMILLKYWRDQASHGIATRISDNEAYTSLVTLLRFAHFVRDHWTDLTRSDGA